MDPQESHQEVIGELLGAAFDGEASLPEREQAIALTETHPELAAHVSFLSVLRDAMPPVEFPATLSERIALATHARPTLWSRLCAALRPAPLRYATAGLALSGLGALGLLFLRSDGSEVGSPAVAPTPGMQIAVNSSPAPALPTPEPDAKVPSPDSSPAPVAASRPERPIELPPPSVSDSVPPRTEIARTPVAAPPVRVEPRPTPEPTPLARVRPAPAPKAPVVKPSPLPPAQLAEPPTGTLSVAMESGGAGVLEVGSVKDLGESDPVVAQPRAASSVVSASAAAIADPSESSGPRSETVKISLSQSREKLAALSAQTGTPALPGNKIAVVSDGERR